MPLDEMMKSREAESVPLATPQEDLNDYKQLKITLKIIHVKLSKHRTIRQPTRPVPCCDSCLIRHEKSVILDVVRILMISNSFPPYEKGAYEQLCRDVAERFVQKDHRVAVLTSKLEGKLSHTMIEGVDVCRVAVAATRGGTGEINEHGRTGLLCPPADKDAKIEQILRLLQEPKLRLRLAVTGQRRVLENYGVENMVEKLEAFPANAVLSKAGK